MGQMTPFLRLGPFTSSELVKLYKIDILCTNKLFKFLLSELKFDLKERWLISRSPFRNILTPFSCFSSVMLFLLLQCTWITVNALSTSMTAHSPHYASTNRTLLIMIPLRLKQNAGNGTI